MPFFAFLTRALRVESRSLMATSLRLVIGLAVLLAIYSTHEWAGLFGAPGLVLFQWLTWIGLVLVVASGMLYFASAIAEEREERTLPLLRMTRLHPLAIFTGKYAARLIGSTQLFITPFPFVLLCITLGGVTWSQIHEAFVALLLSFFVATALGMFCSTVASTTGRALVGTVALIVAWLLWPLVPALVGKYLQGNGTEVQFLNEWPILYPMLRACTLSSPFVRLVELTMGGTLGGILEHPHTWFCIAIGGVFLGASALVFGLRAHDAEPAWGKLRRRHSRRACRLALAWKDGRFVFRSREFLWRVPVYALFVGGGHAVFKALVGFLAGDFSEWLLGWFTVAVIIELSIFALRVLSHEVAAGTHSALYSLPRTTVSMCLERLLSLWKVLLLPAVLMTWACILDSEEVASYFNGLWFSEEGLLALSVCLCGWHLIAWLSLRIRYWALLVAPALIVGSIILMGPMFRWDPEVVMVVYCLTIPILQVLCVTRLSRLAAQ